MDNSTIVFSGEQWENFILLAIKIVGDIIRFFCEKWWVHPMKNFLTLKILKMVALGIKYHGRCSHSNNGFWQTYSRRVWLDRGDIAYISTKMMPFWVKNSTYYISSKKIETNENMLCWNKIVETCICLHCFMKHKKVCKLNKFLV